MDIFGNGNKISCEDTGHGFVKVTVDNKSLFVNEVIVDEKWVNCTDVVKVAQSCSKAMTDKNGKISFEELQERLTEEYGAKVRVA